MPIIHLLLLSTIRNATSFSQSLSSPSTHINSKKSSLYTTSHRAISSDTFDITPIDFHSILLSRRTINDFDPKLPDGWEESLEKAIIAATYAPNHKRTEPWRFHLLGPATIERVCRLNAKLISKAKGSEEAGEKKFQRWIRIPGWLVVTCVQDENCTSMDDDPSGTARENYAAVCCAIQNLCLSLHADGIGTKWTTGAVNFDPLFADVVGLPDNEYVVGTLWFGKCSIIPEMPKKKLSIGDILTKHD